MDPGEGPLRRWFKEQSARRQRVVRIEDALIGDRFFAYVRYRLRFFAVRYAADSFVHAVRFLFLYAIFRQGQFYAVVAAYAAAAAIESFWWGALEVMRARVRELFHSGNPTRVPREIGRWLSLSAVLAALALLGSGAWIATRAFLQPGHFTPADLYMTSIFTGLAAALLTRCYHSGIYALRRVYRPVGAILAVELGGFVLTLILWPLLGTWSFPAAMLVSTIGSGGVVVIYTRRAYTFLGFHPERYVKPGRLPRLRGHRHELIGAGLSNVVMDMDAYLVLALALAHGGAGSALFVVLFAAAPTVRAGVGWVRLFYFDLKRLDVVILGSVSRRFERRLTELAVALGVVAWLLAGAIGTLVYRGGLTQLYLPLLAFFVARSILATLQMAGFSRRAYGAVLASGAVVIAGLIVVRLQLLDDASTVLALTLAAGAGAVVVAAVTRLLSTTQRLGKSGETLDLSAWLSAVTSARGALRISVARFAVGYERVAGAGTRARTGVTERRELAARVARRLGRCGRAASLFPDAIVWYEAATRTTVVDDEWLLTRSAGAIRSIERQAAYADGPAAVRGFLESGVLGDSFSAGPGEPTPRSVDQLTDAFSKLFPDGTVHALRRRAPATVRSMPSKAKQVILADAIRFSREFRRSGARSRFEVTTLCTGGAIERIFIADGYGDAAVRSQWHRFIREANLSAAVRQRASPAPVRRWTAAP